MTTYSHNDQTTGPVIRMRMSIASVLFVLALQTSLSQANHPGKNIDQYMEDRDKYFQTINLPSAPPFRLRDEAGNTVTLSDFSDKVVILNFVFTNCQDVCPLHTRVIADIQANINKTPMKNDVQFISITTDPGYDTSDILKTYGQTHNLDPINWKFLTVLQGMPNSTTRDLANAYNVKFELVKWGQQMHAAVTHIIDKNGRFAAKFHGLEFDRVNLILYVNGLINNWYANDNHHPKSFWDNLVEFLSFSTD